VSASLWRDIATLTLEHLQLAGWALLVACLLALPLGVWITRRPTARRLAIGLANILQTIPSLALLGFLIPVPLIGGLGPRPAVTALVLYALLPILRNTVTGLTTVDPAVLESAAAMGFSARQTLWWVELPLASRTILAGVRLAAVATIGTATIAAAIGGGGLGVLIFRGVATVDHFQILAGAVPAALLALGADALLGWIENGWIAKRFSP
jgi:osmoprotectant transport system permease protein